MRVSNFLQRVGSRAGGVVLVEMVLVLLLLGIVALTALAPLGWPAFRVGAAARKLFSDVLYAKRMAMAQKLVGVSRTPCGMEVDTANNRYRIYYVMNGVNLDDPHTKSVGLLGQPWTSGLVVDYTSHPDLQGVDLVSTNFDVPGTGNQLRFDSQGRPKKADNTLLTTPGEVVVSYQGVSRTLTIQPNTGHLEVI